MHFFLKVALVSLWSIMPRMSSEKRRKIALILNLAIVLIEGVILFNCYFGFITVNGRSSGGGYLMFRFFTEDSNILLGLSSLAYLIADLVSYKKKTSLPAWVKSFRYIASVAITTTALVVLFFLAPYCGVVYGNFWGMWGFPNTFFTHFVCPVLSLVSAIFFEEPLENVVPWKEAFLGLSTVLLYAIVVGSLASTQTISSDPQINNVYGFMDATAGPWWVTPLAFTLIISETYGEGVLLLFFEKKRQSKNQASVSKKA